MHSPPSRTPWPDFRAVWRWHFYAGLVCIPFVIVLAVSGSVYLFKAELEAWQERRYDRLADGTAAPPSAQVAAVLAAFPGGRFEGYEMPAGPGRAARILFHHPGDAAHPDGGVRKAYVDPVGATLLGSVWESERFMKVVSRIHGELLMADRGSNLVELAACWTIVMVLTGLVLWWPRQRRGLAGVAWPRLRGGRRLFVRDLHAVTAAWLSMFTLLLLVSGLPWARGWGDWLKTARRWTGTAAVRQDWSNAKGRRVDESHGAGAGDRTGIDPAALDRVAAVVGRLALDPPVVLAPEPGSGGARWSAKSQTANRPRRVSLVVDGATGAVESRDDFSAKHPIDKAVAIGIALHEGRLFGWPNQLLGLLTAIGLVVVCLSAVWLWLRRRDPGTLGAPPPGVPAARSLPLIVTVLVLGILLPLFGMSLVAVLVVERTLLRRIPAVAAWLGLEERSPGRG